MKGVIENQAIFIVGEETLLESNSPHNSYAAFFEDEGETGYFYALDMELEEPVIDALQIYNVSQVTDGNIPSTVKIAWSNDGLKTALLINEYVHAVFDFDSKRGYCRTGFPPITDWSKNGHEWSDKALELFS
ncbi:hypothetical protein BH10ACI2_BH10ACI2_13180 [soil metagenome]